MWHICFEGCLSKHSLLIRALHKLCSCTYPDVSNLTCPQRLLCCSYNDLVYISMHDKWVFCQVQLYRVAMVITQVYHAANSVCAGCLYSQAMHTFLHATVLPRLQEHTGVVLPIYKAFWTGTTLHQSLIKSRVISQSRSYIMFSNSMQDQSGAHTVSCLWS